MLIQHTIVYLNPRRQVGWCSAKACVAQHYVRMCKGEVCGAVAQQYVGVCKGEVCGAVA